MPTDGIRIAQVVGQNRFNVLHTQLSSPNTPELRQTPGPTQAYRRVGQHLQTVICLRDRLQQMIGVYQDTVCGI